MRDDLLDIHVPRQLGGDRGRFLLLVHIQRLRLSFNSKAAPHRLDLQFLVLYGGLVLALEVKLAMGRHNMRPLR